MKKILSIIFAAAISGAACLFYTPAKTTTEKEVSKTINMSVFTDNNYTAKIYDAATAGLTITVKKVNNKKDEIVWQQTFPALELKLFPGSVNAFKKAIQIPAIFEKDLLQVSYTLTYDADGSVLQMEASKVVTATDNSLLSINV